MVHLPPEHVTGGHEPHDTQAVTSPRRTGQPHATRSWTPARGRHARREAGAARLILLAVLLLEIAVLLGEGGAFSTPRRPPPRTRRPPRPRRPGTAGTRRRGRSCWTRPR